MKVKAAIPELLEALKEGAEIISALEAVADNVGIDLSEVRDWWIKADEAIARAEGN